MTAFGRPAPSVVVPLGSKSDLDHRDAIAWTLKKFGLSYESRFASLHRVTTYLLEMLRANENDGQPYVYIAVAE